MWREEERCWAPGARDLARATWCEWRGQRRNKTPTEDGQNKEECPARRKRAATIEAWVVNPSLAMTAEAWSKGIPEFDYIHPKGRDIGLRMV